MKSSRSRLTIAMVAAFALVPLAACSSSSGLGRLVRRQDGDHAAHRQRGDDGEAREGCHRSLREGQPDDHRQDRDPAGRLGRRQPRQDEALDRRHGGRLLVQLRLAAAGPQPGEDPRRPDERPGAQGHRPLVPAGRHPERQGLRRAVGHGDGWRRPLQQGRLLPARTVGAQDVGRVRVEQRQDQGRRDHAGSRHPEGHLHLAAVRPRRLPQRRRLQPQVGGGVHGEQGQVRAPTRSRSRGSRRRPSPSRRAGSTAAPAPRPSPRESSSWRRARRRSTPC